MESDDSDDHMVAVTAKVPRDVRDEIDEHTSDDQPRSQVIRSLIRDGLDERGDEPVMLRIVTLVVFLLVTGFPTWLAYTGSLTAAIGFIVVVGVADLLQSFRGGKTLIRL